MTEASQAGTIRLENLTILDGTRGEPILDGIIDVRSGRIAYAGPASGSRERQNPCCTYDARGAVALPGLIDLHVHTTSFLDECLGSNPPHFSAELVAEDVLRLAGTLSGALREGVTGLRDCGFPHRGIFAVRERIRGGLVDGPRLWLSGRAICATGGHAEGIAVGVSGSSDVTRAVRNEVKAGADWIKLMVTGGTATPGERPEDVQLELLEMRTAVAEAERRGRFVSAHCSCIGGIQQALEAGVRSIEHGIGLDEETVTRMRDASVCLVPTLACSSVEAEADPSSGIPQHTRERAKRIYAAHRESVVLAARQGVTIGCGTDAGPGYFPIGMRAVVSEMKALLSTGMSSDQVLCSATRVSAEILGAESQLGTIETGKLADIVIVEADPRQDIDTLLSPVAVMKDGIFVVGFFE